MNKELIMFFDDLLREGAWGMPHTRFYNMVEFQKNKEPQVIVSEEELYAEFIQIGKKLLNNKYLSDRKKRILQTVLTSLESKEYDKNDFSFINYKYPIIKSNENNEDVILSFTERYEKYRTETKLEKFQHTVDILEKLYSYEISLNNPLVWESMRNELTRFGEDYHDVVTSLLAEYYNQSDSAKRRIIDLAKDPGRQNIAEEMQTLIASEKNVILQKLPERNNDSLYITARGIFKLGDLLKNERKSKSLDFQVKNSSDLIYCFNKYTKQTGGNQDNVLDEAKTIIELFGGYQNAKLLLILDGNYWNKKRSQLHSNNKNVMIISSDDYDLNEVKNFLNLI